MCLSRFGTTLGVGFCLVLGGRLAQAQGVYVTNGNEYAIAGTLPGDQVRPSLALSPDGGFLVWQDNITDGSGLGISAQRLDNNYSAYLSPFRVNATLTADQERPQVSLLKNGGAVFVWQGGVLGSQHIYARFLSSSNTFLTTTDLTVNSSTNFAQQSPAVATLANGNVIVVYSSLNQTATNSMQDIYGQMFTATGQKLGGEFLVNQFTSYNQRTPAIASLSGGGFVVVWVSELQRSGPVDSGNPNNIYSPTNQPSVDIYAKLFSASGTPATGELLVNTDYVVCANPRVAAASDGGFMVVWGQKNPATPVMGWDIASRLFAASGAGGTVQAVNTYLYGDQYIPQVSALGSDYLVVWTSLGQDGYREGVFGQFMRNGAMLGEEFRVNTTVIGQQLHPAVASDGNGRFVVTWTSFIGGAGSFDLFAQRYLNGAQPLLAMNAPFVWVPFLLSNTIYQPQIQVSWPSQAGLPVAYYEVYVDGASTPAASVTNNTWTLTGITANSTHTFKVAYVVADGRRSPLSPASTATTWMGFSWFGSIPFEWMAGYFGYDTSKWPVPGNALVPGGPNIVQVFLSGGNPLDPGTWLRISLANSAQGYFLSWNPQPGMTYQVQSSTNLLDWSDVGGARFAAGNADSIFVGFKNAGYYRVLRLR